jgi:SAM-dependent methyltransferase
MARAPAGRVVVGVDRDANLLAYGRQRFPWATLLEGDVAALPVPDESADAILLLDVLEHVPTPDAAIAEARRVLRPGGVLILSVPHRGLLHWLDALNLYRVLRRRWPSLPPLPPSTESAGGMHRHFTINEIEDLIGPSFMVDKVARTGLGLPELPYLLMLVARVPLRTRDVPPIFLLCYTIAHIADDLIPTGLLGYNLTVRARA